MAQETRQKPRDDRAGSRRPRIPSHAEHVGSLLRPAELKEARTRAEDGEVPPSELRAVEDRLIARAIQSQSRAGLRSVTDGEFRRAYWHLDFLGALEGLSLTREQSMIPGTATRNAGFVHRHRLQVTGRVGWNKHGSHAEDVGRNQEVVLDVVGQLAD